MPGVSVGGIVGGRIQGGLVGQRLFIVLDGFGHRSRGVAEDAGDHVCPEIRGVFLDDGSHVLQGLVPTALADEEVAEGGIAARIVRCDADLLAIGLFCQIQPAELDTDHAQGLVDSRLIGGLPDGGLKACHGVGGFVGLHVHYGEAHDGGAEVRRVLQRGFVGLSRLGIVVPRTVDIGPQHRAQGALRAYGVQALKGCQGLVGPAGGEVRATQEGDAFEKVFPLRNYGLEIGHCGMRSTASNVEGCELERGLDELGVEGHGVLEFRASRFDPARSQVGDCQLLAELGGPGKIVAEMFKRRGRQFEFPPVQHEAGLEESSAKVIRGFLENGRHRFFTLIEIVFIERKLADQLPGGEKGGLFVENLVQHSFCGVVIPAVVGKRRPANARCRGDRSKGRRLLEGGCGLVVPAHLCIVGAQPLQDVDR